MKMFVAAKFKGDENKADIEALCAAVRSAGFEEFCFIRDVEKYQRGVFSDPHELMERARTELLKCDALLIDLTERSSNGRILEAGIAFGNNKLVVVIAKHGTELSVPMRGIATNTIAYSNLNDIIEPLRALADKQ